MMMMTKMMMVIMITTTMMLLIIMMMTMMIIHLIHAAQFNTNGILAALKLNFKFHLNTYRANR